LWDYFFSKVGATVKRTLRNPKYGRVTRSARKKKRAMATRLAWYRKLQQKWLDSTIYAPKKCKKIFEEESGLKAEVVAAISDKAIRNLSPGDFFPAHDGSNLDWRGLMELDVCGYLWLYVGNGIFHRSTGFFTVDVSASMNAEAFDEGELRNKMCYFKTEDVLAFEFGTTTPLPAGWELRTTADAYGRVYYVDQNTKTVSWEHPITNETSDPKGKRVEWVE